MRRTSSSASAREDSRCRVTCVVSSLITERAAKKLAMDDSEPGKESSTETEKILVSLANPDTIGDMMNLSLVIRDTKLKDNLLAPVSYTHLDVYKRQLLY